LENYAKGSGANESEKTCNEDCRRKGNCLHDREKKKGSGRIEFNNTLIENIGNSLISMRMREPIVLLGDRAKSYDVRINVKGGGIIGQVEAARQALARGFADIFGDEVKKMYLEYDRNLLVYDSRRTEPHKPPRSSQGPRRYKQRSKR